MSSNYPPGVTGNEPQITGYRSDEVVITGLCEDDNDLGHYCGFTGDVVAERQYVDAYGSEALVVDFWTCPDCGGEHEDESTIGADQ